MSPVARPASRRLLAGLGLAGVLALGGCATNSTYDQLAQTKPSGSTFAQALFSNYSYLARSFDIADTPSTTAFDANAAFSLTGVDANVADVANAYAAKALQAAKGEEPLPEPAPTDDQSAENMRLRLLRALDTGRTKAPAESARVQAEYDCWILDAPVPELSKSASHCYQSFNRALPQLEHDLGLKPPTPNVIAGEKPAPAQEPVPR